MYHARYKLFLLICCSLFFIQAKSQYIIPADTINAPLQIIPSVDSIFKQRDTTQHTSADSLQKLQDAMFKKAYQQNKGGTDIKDLPKNKHGKVDTMHYSPKKAALWGLAFPGLGQVYNKKYWKLPIVYAVIGTVAYFVGANAKKLKEFNGYIRNIYDSVPNPSPYDQLDISQIEADRNVFRRNVQLASFGTAIAWGLSIVDAVVDAHLHSFDISNKLSMKIKPEIKSFDNTYYTGLTLNLAFK